MNSFSSSQGRKRRRISDHLYGVSMTSNFRSSPKVAESEKMEIDEGAEIDDGAEMQITPIVPSIRSYPSFLYNERQNNRTDQGMNIKAALTLIKTPTDFGIRGTYTTRQVIPWSEIETVIQSYRCNIHDNDKTICEIYECPGGRCEINKDQCEYIS